MRRDDPIRYHGHGFSFRLIGDWQLVEDEVADGLYRQNGPGALNISSATKVNVKELTDDDLMISMNKFDSPLYDIKCGELSGIYTERIEQKPLEEDTFWRHIILRTRNILIYITYNCPAAQKDEEYELVNQMLSTMRAEGIEVNP